MTTQRAPFLVRAAAVVGLALVSACGGTDTSTAPTADSTGGTVAAAAPAAAEPTGDTVAAAAAAEPTGDTIAAAAPAPAPAGDTTAYCTVMSSIASKGGDQRITAETAAEMQALHEAAPEGPMSDATGLLAANMATIVEYDASGVSLEESTLHALELMFTPEAMQAGETFVAAALDLCGIVMPTS